eukprot:809849_1
MSGSKHTKIMAKCTIFLALIILIIYDASHFRRQQFSLPALQLPSQLPPTPVLPANASIVPPIRYFNSKGLITAKCVTKPLDHINNGTALLAEYSNAITKSATLKMKFYLYNDFPIEMIRDVWTVYQQQRFEYLKNHPNRVYDISQAQIVIFQTTLGIGGHCPCYGVSEYASIQPYVNETHYGDSITNDEWKRFYQKKQLDTKIRWIPFQNVSRHFGFGMPPQDELYEHLIRTIHDMHSQYPDLHFFLFAHTYTGYGYSLKERLKKSAFDRTMTAAVDMDNQFYRKHFDISLPPSFIAGVERDNELIIKSQSMDPCRKRKFFTTFYGEPASHRSRPWIIRFDDVLIDTDYMMTPRGTQRFSFRWREGLEAGTINIMIADDYILPFEDHIDWKHYEEQNALVIIKEDEFIDTTNATIQAQGQLDLKRMWLKPLDMNELCRAHTKVKELREMYFKDTSIETNTLLFNIQNNIVNTQQ